MGVAGNRVGAVSAVRTGALVVVMAIAGVSNPPPVFACAYEDPSAADFQQGVISAFYPKSLYVLGALTQAQLNGIIPSEPAPRANYLAGYLKTDHVCISSATRSGINEAKTASWRSRSC